MQSSGAAVLRRLKASAPSSEIRRGPSCDMTTSDVVGVGVGASTSVVAGSGVDVSMLSSTCGT
eukprot:2753233-Alexandrium_andersonii.AAC.1